MKYVVGTARAKPGKREEFLAAGRIHGQTTRREPGCVFFELSPQMDSEDGIIISECYQNAEAHRRHDETPHMQAFIPIMRSLLASCVLDMVISDTVERIEIAF